MPMLLGKPVPHDSALGHVTGQAPYIDDLRPMAGELYVGFVGSPVAAGQLLSVDTSAALAMPGVVGCYTVADVPGHNMFGVVVRGRAVSGRRRGVVFGPAGCGRGGRNAGRAGEGAQGGAG